LGPGETERKATAPKSGKRGTKKVLGKGNNGCFDRKTKGRIIEGGVKRKREEVGEPGLTTKIVRNQ